MLRFTLGAPVPRVPMLGMWPLTALPSADVVPERAEGSAGRAGCGDLSALGTGRISLPEPEPSCLHTGQEGESWQSRPWGTKGLRRCPGEARQTLLAPGPAGGHPHCPFLSPFAGAARVAGDEGCHRPPREQRTSGAIPLAVLGSQVGAGGDPELSAHPSFRGPPFAFCPGSARCRGLPGSSWTNRPQRGEGE